MPTSFSLRACVINPNQYICRRIGDDFEVVNGRPVIHRRPALHFLNEKSEKPVSIERFIGRRPILAVGNSDGDYQMLEWTSAGAGRRLGLILHHTDAAREWAYDRNATTGRLDRGLDDAAAHGWLLIDMATEWKRVFPAEKPE